MFADLHFIRPYWLLSLIPLLSVWLLMLKYRQPQSPWQRFIAPHLQLHLLGQHHQRPQFWPVFLLALCWLLAAVAMAGPSWQRVEQPAIAVNKATVLIIDMSMSMYATDMSPNRLTQARFKALDYIDALQEGELALIAFAGDSFVVSPLTPDHNNVRLLLPTLRPDIMPTQGSNFYAALRAADQLLQQAGYPQGDIVALVDGFDRHTEQELTNLISQLPHRLSIIAFGNEDAAPVKLPDGSLLQDSRGTIVLPRVPLSQLNHLARRSGGVFQQAELSDSDIQAILNQAELSTNARLEQQLKTAGDVWRDNAIYLVWLLLPLALWLGKRGQLFVVCLLVWPHESMAREFSWWQTPQQQALQAYQQGDYQQAQQKFSDQHWQAQAAYRAGDYLSAEHAWRRLSEQTPSADTSYNLGNALAQQGRYDEALAAYQQALQQQPDQTQAQQNAALMETLLQQQQEEQQQEESASDEHNDAQDSDQSNSQESDNTDESSGSQQDGESDAQDGADPSEPHAHDDAADEGQDQQDEANPNDEHADETGSNEEQTAPQPEQGEQQIIESPWPDASPEEEQQLMNMLRKVQDDPALLLRNRMHIEHQRRRQNQLPTGVKQEW